MNSLVGLFIVSLIKETKTVCTVTKNSDVSDTLYIIRSLYITDQGRVYLTNIRLTEGVWAPWEYDKTHDITWAHTFTVRQAVQMMRLKAQDARHFECVQLVN